MDLEGDEVFRTARHLIEEGRAGEAAAALRSLLERSPDEGARVRLELARALFLDGDAASARGELLVLTREEGTHPAAWANLGAACGELGLLEEEREAYDKARFPGSVPWELVYDRALHAVAAGDGELLRDLVADLEARGLEGGEAAYLRGALEEHREDHEAAAEAYAQAVERSPTMWEARYALGRALTRLERWDEAREVLEEARDAAGDRWEPWHALGLAEIGAERRPAAREALEGAIRRAPPEEVGPAHDLGQALLAWKDAAGAASVLRDASARAPDDADLRLLLGRALFLTREYEEAAAVYARVVEDDPQHFRAHYNLAYSLERTGRDGEAVEVYEKALKRRPGHYKTMSKLSRLHSKAGDFERALREADRSLQQERESNGEGFLARAIALKGLGRLEEALGCAREAAEREGKNPEAHLELAFHLRRLGLTGEAKESAKRALSLTPDDPEALLELGFAYLEEEGEDAGAKAKTAFKRALDRSSGNRRALSGLAQASARVDSPERALEKAVEAVEAGGGYRAYDALALCYSRAGQPRKAIDAWKHALTRNKGFAAGYRGISECYATLGDEERARKYQERYERVRAGEESRREELSTEIQLAPKG